MTYKLLNKLFGWDYIHWENCVSSGIARIHIDAEGRPYYWRYKIAKCLDHLDRVPSNEITWLTCKREKYFPSQISN